MRMRLYLLVTAAVLVGAPPARAGNWFKEKFEEGKKRAKQAYDDAGGDLAEARNKTAKAAQQYWQNIRNVTSKGASEELWGEAGRGMYIAASLEMQRRAAEKPAPAQPLSDALKLQLYREYGQLVHTVRLHWGMGDKMLDKFSVGDGAKLLGIPAEVFRIPGVNDLKDISLDGESDAQVFGYDIYLKGDKRDYKGPQDADLLALMAHEMEHSRQYERLGKSLSEFGYQYFKGFKKADQNYKNNRMEEEARAVEERVKATKPVDWSALPGNTDQKIEAALLAQFTTQVMKKAGQQARHLLLSSPLLLGNLIPWTPEEVPPTDAEVQGFIKAQGFIKEFINFQRGGAENQVRWRLHGDRRIFWIAVDHTNPNGTATTALLQHAAVTGKKVYLTVMKEDPENSGYFHAAEVIVTFPEPKK